MSNSSIWLIDRILTGFTILGHCGTGSDGNEGVLRILQSTRITGALQSNDLVLYPRHLLCKGVGLTLLQRYSLCILQPRSTEADNVCMYLLDQTTMSRMRNMVHFLSGVQLKMFPSSRPPDIPRLKSTASPTIYPKLLAREGTGWIISFQGVLVLDEMQSRPGFGPGSPNLFPPTRLVAIPRLKRPVFPTFSSIAGGRIMSHTSLQVSRYMWNANSFVQDLNSGRRLH